MLLMSGNASAPDLSSRRVVVAGGTGSVGEGIVRGYLDAGADVIVPTRTQARADAFRQVIGGSAERLRLVIGDYTTLESARALAERIEAEHGPVTDAAASIGGWWQGPPLTGTSRSAWDEYFTGYATAHLAVAQAFVPRIGPEGAYHIIVGASGLFPVPGSGIVSMQQAALLMMGRVLQAENDGRRRVFTHVLGVVNNRNRPQQRAEWISATDVGELAASISGNPQITSTGFQLLDQSAFQQALNGVRAGGTRS